MCGAMLYHAMPPYSVVWYTLSCHSVLCCVCLIHSYIVLWYALLAYRVLSYAIVPYDMIWRYAILFWLGGVTGTSSEAERLLLTTGPADPLLLLLAPLGMSAGIGRSDAKAIEAL